MILIAVTAVAGDMPRGVLEGHLKILSSKEVELAPEENSSTVTAKTEAQTYEEYPLIVRSRDGQKEIARVTADTDGNYRVSLPPGDYVLDVKGRRPGGIRAKPQSFTVVSSQTVRVDMDIDTGIR